MQVMRMEGWHQIKVRMVFWLISDAGEIFFSNGGPLLFLLSQIAFSSINFIKVRSRRYRTITKPVLDVVFIRVSLQSKCFQECFWRANMCLNRMMIMIMMVIVMVVLMIVKRMMMMRIIIMMQMFSWVYVAGQYVSQYSTNGGYAHCRLTHCCCIISLQFFIHIWFNLVLCD